MLSRPIFALALLPLVLGVPVAADEDRAGQVFEGLDLNGDGIVDRDELRALRARVFNSMDADRDGMLRRAEYVERWLDAAVGENDPRRAALAEQRGHDFDALAGAGGNAVSKRAYIAAGDARFDEADTDGDGRLTYSEFAAASGTDN